MNRTRILNLLHRGGPLITVALFAIALLVIHHELKIHPWSEVIGALKATSWPRIAAAAGLTALGFVALVSYDWLGFRYVGYPLPTRRIALAGFVGYAFSQSIGHSLLSGGSIRLRLYSTWGLSGLDISRVLLFGWLTLYMGIFGLGGALLTIEAERAAPFLHMPVGAVRAVGIGLLCALGALLLWSHFRKTPLRLRGIELRLPTLRLSLAQVAISSIDMALAGSVLYVLLPSSSALSLPAFLAVYLIAVVAGTVSQLPGGIGVMEGIMLTLLTPELSETSVIGAMLVYRIVYTIAPLVLAALLLAAFEIRERRPSKGAPASVLGRNATWLVPNVLAITTFVGGVVLLLSGATPAVQSRLEWINAVLPLPIIEGAHFLASIAGLLLLILARGIQLRLDGAYWMTMAVLVAGIVLSLLKGGDYEEAMTLGVMLLALAPCHSRFIRRASVLHEPFTPGWIAAIITAIGVTVWLVLFTFHHVEYSSDLWWRFALDSHAPRALRALVAVAIAAALFAGFRLLRTAEPRTVAPTPSELDEAEVLARASRATYAYLALLGDKLLAFSPARDAYIMYADQGRSSIVMGDPVGNAGAGDDLVWQFRNRCHQHRRWPVFYQVHPDNLDLYVDLGLTMVKLGEDARVHLPDFSLEGSGRKSLRRTVRDVRNESCTVEFVPRDDVAAILPELRRISDDWLGTKNTGEKGFSLGSFSEAYVRRFPAAVVRRAGTPVAFVNLWCGAEREELSVDLMRYSQDAPDRVMEYLFCEVILWGKAQDYQWFNLGMAPLAGLENRPLAPVWNRAGGLMFRHGEHFYNFKGLRAYKEKFDPVWTPKYLASPGGLALPRIFLDISTLISGGVGKMIGR